jgi:hypothetical protein
VVACDCLLAMRALLAVCLMPMLGCLALSTSQPDAGAASSADGGTGGEGGGSGGTGCGTDPATGLMLCLGTNACPGLSVDQGSFPGCGFRQGGTSELDLECACAGGQLCPIGVPTSCDAAAQLLMQQQSSLQVCQQASTGGCLSFQDAGGSSSGSTTGSSTGSSSSSGGPTLSAACQACVSSCGGTPACFQSCGC